VCAAGLWQRITGSGSASEKIRSGKVTTLLSAFNLDVVTEGKAEVEETSKANFWKEN